MKKNQVALKQAVVVAVLFMFPQFVYAQDSSVSEITVAPSSIQVKAEPVINLDHIQVASTVVENNGVIEIGSVPNMDVVDSVVTILAKDGVMDISQDLHELNQVEVSTGSLNSAEGSSLDQAIQQVVTDAALAQPVAPSAQAAGPEIYVVRANMTNPEVTVITAQAPLSSSVTYNPNVNVVPEVTAPMMNQAPIMNHSMPNTTVNNADGNGMFEPTQSFAGVFANIINTVQASDMAAAFNPTPTTVVTDMVAPAPPQTTVTEDSIMKLSSIPNTSGELRTESTLS